MTSMTSAQSGKKVSLPPRHKTHKFSLVCCLDDAEDVLPRLWELCATEKKWDTLTGSLSLLEVVVWTSHDRKKAQECVKSVTRAVTAIARNISATATRKAQSPIQIHHCLYSHAPWWQPEDVSRWIALRCPDCLVLDGRGGPRVCAGCTSDSVVTVLQLIDVSDHLNADVDPSTCLGDDAWRAVMEFVLEWLVCPTDDSRAVLMSDRTEQVCWRNAITDDPKVVTIVAV